MDSSGPRAAAKIVFVGLSRHECPSFILQRALCRLDSILGMWGRFDAYGEMIVFPVHPRARITIMKLYHPFLTKLKASPVRLINIVGYHDMLIMEQNARLILTDSAGMQREAFFFAFPCVTL